jgi:uroporphyrinogen decarboxylase
MTLSHRARLERTLSGEKPDRPPVSLWRHFPVDDQNPATLAASIVRFQERFDFDFVKITYASSYPIMDYGLRDEWKGNPEGTRQITKHVIESTSDWLKLKPLHPRKGSLGEQLKSIELIRKALPADTPIIQTIFSPLSQAKNLVGRENVVSHLRMYPEQVEAALQVLTENNIRFIEECIKLGIDGVFYAVQHAQYGLLTPDEFSRFATHYDKQVLESTKSLWLNVGHIHGENIMFDAVAEYPVQILNWHDLETAPTLREGKKKYSGTVCGGMKQWETLTYGSPELVTREAREAIKQTDGTRFILGTGCVTPIIAPDSNIFAARQAVDGNK